jgi:hypothetical protein
LHHREALSAGPEGFSGISALSGHRGGARHGA